MYRPPPPRDPARIGLSATLGDPERACRWLRPDGRPVKLIEAQNEGTQIGIRVRGLWRRPPPPGEDESTDDPAVRELARAILLACRGYTNLVFSNSKSQIEELADSLTSEAKALSIPDEIVVHHGSLSKERREYAEARLRDERPCTAVCSNTLEMGIDIGEIDSVVQVSAPWSVASLVQRLGRSGRRAGSQRTLRGFFVEDAPDERSSVWDNLHLGFIQGVAAIELMLEHFLEPPRTERAHTSTLVQQILSTLAETGGAKALELYRRLNESGAFGPIGRDDFALLLRSLGHRELVEQMGDGSLVLGVKGQKIVEHYTFYAAFRASNEFRVLHGTSEIGSLPEASIPLPGEHLILAGRRWQVQDIDGDRKQVFVVPSRGRKLPRFGASMPDLDARMHRKMRELLVTEPEPVYLDDTSKEILRRAREAAARCNRFEPAVQPFDGGVRVFLWAGSRVQKTLWLLLKQAGLRVESETRGAGFDVFDASERWASVFRDFIARPDGAELAAYAEEKLHARTLDGEKYDRYVPSQIWRATYVNERLDLKAAAAEARRLEEGMGSSQVQFRDGPVDVRVVQDSAEWASAIMELDGDSPLPVRTVIVANEAVAHSLRRTLIASGAVATLIGTRFMTSVTIAREILRVAGTCFREGEEWLRPLRLRRVFKDVRSLRYFKSDDLCTVPGWDDVFARAILDLEAAGLRAETLIQLGEHAVAVDLGAIWQALDADAKDSWTIPRMLAEAMRLLSANPALWPFDGPTLWPVAASCSAAEAELARCAPRVRLGLISARPARRRALERIGELFGRTAYEALRGADIPRGASDELSLLRSFLFEPPQVLATLDRKRSSGIDGSVSLECHSGADQEIEAAADWVSREILQHQTPFEDVAVLVAGDDRLQTMVAERLRRIRIGSESLPLFVANGVPAHATAAGARIEAVLNALEAYLPLDLLADIVPTLRLADGDGHLSRGRALELIYSLGFAGGSAVRRLDALEWRSRFPQAEKLLSDRASNSGGDDGSDNEVRRAKRLLEALVGIRPALATLVDVAELVIQNQPLPVLWTALHAFIDRYLLLPGDKGVLVATVNEALAAISADPGCSTVAGPEALETIRSALARARLHEGRFGDPAIYVGTPQSAVGLRFSAVRILGLCEGSAPRPARDSPALPQSLRAALGGHLLSTPEDLAIAQLHALDRVVRDTTARLSLSTARVDVDGVEHEPASLFAEAAAALGRDDPAQQEAGVIPSLEAIERVAFAPARAETRTFRIDNPIDETAWHDRLAAGMLEAPRSWIDDPVRDLDRIRGLLSTTEAGPMDGVFASDAPIPPLPGLTSERYISPSAVGQLLECPHHFLHERVLGLRAPPMAPSLGRVDTLAYGTLFHRIAQQFYEQHGREFGDREATLDEWFARADELARAVFLRFLDEYPLLGEAVRAAELERIRRDVRTLVEYDWDGARPHTFVAVERSFGPLRILAAETAVFIRGRIDRIDRDGDVTVIRDLKTGRAHPRIRDEEAPDPVRDVQLGLYGLVARAMSNEWGVPEQVVAAYAYVDSLAIEKERAFRTDYDQLEKAVQRWLEVSVGLLSARAFPRTPHEDDCRYCDFRPVCGPGAQTRAGTLLSLSSGALAAFKDLKS